MVTGTTGTFRALAEGASGDFALVPASRVQALAWREISFPSHGHSQRERDEGRHKGPDVRVDFVAR